MNRKISSLIEYVSCLIKKYGEIQQIQMKNTFRVANLKSTTHGTKVFFQVIGKATFMESTPSEILSNAAFLEGFSKQDIKKITEALAKDEALKEKPEDVLIISQEFQDGKTKFTLKDKYGTTTSKTAKEIVLDKKTIKKLTKQDVSSISYIAGYEHSQNDIND